MTEPSLAAQGSSRENDVLSELGLVDGSPARALTRPEGAGGFRFGRSTGAERASQRLSTGAVVEELELAGDRLHYRDASPRGTATGPRAWEAQAGLGGVSPRGPDLPAASDS